jgi:Zn-dependent protease with chaperone function
MNLLFALPWVFLAVATVPLLDGLSREDIPILVILAAACLIFFITLANGWYFLSTRMFKNRSFSFALLAFNFVVSYLALYYTLKMVMSVIVLLIVPDAWPEQTWQERFLYGPSNHSEDLRFCLIALPVFLLALWTSSRGMKTIRFDRDVALSAYPPAEQWTQGKRVLRTFSKLVKFEIILAFAALPLAAAYRAFESTKNGTELDAFAFGSLAFALLICFWQIRAYHLSMRRKAEDRTVISKLPSLEDSKLFQVQEMVAELVSAMAISKPVSAVLNIRDFTTCASVVESKKMVCIVIPLGFLKLFHNDSGAAKAILAHELAHVVQDDSKLWRRIDSWWEPYIIGNAFALLGALILGVANYTGLLSHGTVLGGDLDRAKAALLTFPFLIVFQAFCVFVWLRFSLGMRRKSETLADLGAALNSSPQKLAEVLETSGNDRKHGDFARVHPSNRWRLLQLQKIFSGLTTGSAKSPVSPIHF